MHRTDLKNTSITCIVPGLMETSTPGQYEAALRCLYMTLMSLAPTGRGR